MNRVEKHIDSIKMGSICSEYRRKSNITLEQIQHLTGYKKETLELFEQGTVNDMYLLFYYCEFFLDGNMDILRSCII